MWDHTDNWSKQYNFASSVYPISCLALEFFIIIDRVVGAPGNRKYVADGLNDRDKLILKLSMAKLLNPELIQDEPIFQVHAG